MLFDLERAELGDLLSSEPTYRVDQLWQGLYREAKPLADITTLPSSMRESLAEQFLAEPSVAMESVTDNGNTVKLLWELSGSATVESVLMHYAASGSTTARTTVCVSSQAGCAMACSFCATGQAGFERHLTVGEIVYQVLAAQRRSPHRVSNIVFMGMGEPMANFDATWAATRRLHDAVGIGARHLTISTVGVIPGIRRLTEEDLPVGLAVSLHAADNDLRNELVPLNRRYPLEELMEACDEYHRRTRRRVTYEWALISGVNDRYADADRLAALCSRTSAHVNLIPLNPTPGYAVRGSSRNRVHAFATRLRERGTNVTIRDTRGSDIDAACGQLSTAHAAGLQRGNTPPGDGSAQDGSTSAVASPVRRTRG
jgi:23S rRNA (adenine2503-C2)-methyltransferase